MKRENAEHLNLLRNQITDRAVDIVRLVRFRVQAAENIARRAMSTVTPRGRKTSEHQTLAREIHEEITSLYSTIKDYEAIRRMVLLRIRELEKAEGEQPPKGPRL